MIYDLLIGVFKKKFGRKKVTIMKIACDSFPADFGFDTDIQGKLDNPLYWAILAYSRECRTEMLKIFFYVIWFAELTSKGPIPNSKIEFLQ